MKYLLGSLSFLFFVLQNCLAQTNRNYGIIPAPKALEKKVGEFNLDKETAIIFSEAADEKIALLCRAYIEEKTGYHLVIAKNFIKAPKSSIYITSSPALPVDSEAYFLNIDTQQITLQGKERGLFYAFQTFAQLLNQGTKIPALNIQDAPNYAYRGLHLDVSRHFFSVAFIKEYLDLMASYKLNNFHWHLTDDQGWRIEIKKYPKLTEIGANRAQTILGNFHDRMPQWFDGTPYGGFYTQEDIKEIVAYAKSKYINVIPEIDMPGHSLAALAAYPNLACGENPGPFYTAEKWGIFSDIFCAGKNETFDFVEDVLTEVMDLFPSKYIHIGGDEALKSKWKVCPFCQKRIKKEKLKDEKELQSYFIHRVEKFVNKKGRLIIGWDEILEGGLAPNATVMSWQSIKGGIEAAKQKHPTILTPSTEGLYLDHVQGRSDQEPLAIGGDGRIEKIYNYEPSAAFEGNLKKYILGVQGNVWTEYMYTDAKVEYMLLPRLFALSEIAWTIPEKKNFKDFYEERMPLHLSWLDTGKINYRVPTAIGAKDTSILVNNNYQMSIKSPVKGAKIFYTLDGYLPNNTTFEYTLPINVQVPLGQKRVVKTIVITPSGKQSAVTSTWLVNRLPAEAITDTLPKQAGIKYDYVPGYFKYATEIDTSMATKKGISDKISTAGISQKAREYGVVFDGFFKVDENAVFEFSLYSDDGSKLFIDDELLIDNDLKHARFEYSAGVPLKAGLHKIRVNYFDVGPGSGLKVFIKGTDGKKIELPAMMLFH